MRTETGHGTGKRVGIWIRVSTEDQAKGESPEHHEERGRAYAKLKDWNVVEVYRLEGVSGKSVVAQSEAQRMLRDVERGHISGLIFSKLARLARNTKELLEFADHFERHRAHLISLQESIDTTSPAGRFFYTLIAAMAQWEREEIAERVAASVPVRAKLGKPLGGAAPFGYQWKDRQLVPHPDEAPIRTLMYELFLEHRRKRTVARILNERGYRTRNGSKFSDTTVARLVRDPSAKGLRRANYTRSLGEGKKWELKPQSEWVHAEIQPIVSEELWAQCNALLDGSRSARGRVAKRPVHTFAGLTFCECGAKMYVPSNSPKYICQKCRNKIPVEDLDAVYHEQLRHFLISPETITEQLNAVDMQVRQKEEQLDVLHKEQGNVRDEMERVYRLYVADQISPEGFGARYKPLEERFLELDSQVPTLQAELDLLKINFVASDQAFTEAQDLHARWQALEPVQQRRIVESITDKIVIGKGEVSIELCYLPSPPEMVSKEQRNFTGSWIRREETAPETAGSWRRGRCSRIHPPAAGAAPRVRSVGTPASHPERVRRGVRD